MYIYYVKSMKLTILGRFFSYSVYDGDYIIDSNTYFLMSSRFMNTISIESKGFRFFKTPYRCPFFIVNVGG